MRVYFGDGDEFHMGFHFPVMPRLFMAVRREERTPIVEIMQQTPDIPDDCQWAIFLRNHDELTLEMVTDEDRDYMYREYAKDPRMQLNLGIRRRLAPLMDNGRRRIELLHSLLFSLPGTPVMYYGDEIGMGDNIFLGDRNGVRTPMQWTADRNAGFSRADYARLYAPVIADTVYGYQALNVEAQEATPGSFLNWVRELIRVRKQHPALWMGKLRFVNPPNRKVMAFVRQAPEETLLCRLQPRPGRTARGARPLGVAGLDPGGALRRDAVSDHHRPAVPALARCVRLLLVPAAAAGGRERLMNATLEELTAWLGQQRWFGGKGVPITKVEVLERLPLPSTDGTNAEASVVQVSYVLGTPERYLVFLERTADGQLRDALEDPAVARAVLAFAREGRSVPVGTDVVRSEPVGDGRAHPRRAAQGAVGPGAGRGAEQHQRGVRREGAAQDPPQARGGPVARGGDGPLPGDARLPGHPAAPGGAHPRGPERERGWR